MINRELLIIEFGGKLKQFPSFETDETGQGWAAAVLTYCRYRLLFSDRGTPGEMRSLGGEPGDHCASSGGTPSCSGSTPSFSGSTPSCSGSYAAGMALTCRSTLGNSAGVPQGNVCLLEILAWSLECRNVHYPLHWEFCYHAGELYRSKVHSAS